MLTVPPKTAFFAFFSLLCFGGLIIQLMYVPHKEKIKHFLRSTILY